MVVSEEIKLKVHIKPKKGIKKKHCKNKIYNLFKSHSKQTD